MEKPICTNCGNNDTHKVKSWNLKGGKGGVNFRVDLYECNHCTKRFRKLERI